MFRCGPEILIVQLRPLFVAAWSKGRVVKYSSRRAFIRNATVAAMATLPSAGVTAQGTDTNESSEGRGIDLMRPPDEMSARFTPNRVEPMQRSGEVWAWRGLHVIAVPVAAEGRRRLPIRVTHGEAGLTHLRLRWHGKQSGSLLCLGDAWERSYGDLEWRATVPERVMPWYFLTFDGKAVKGYGVETQPSAFCFWQHDASGITLILDLRNGGGPTELGTRELLACTIASRMGAEGESISQASQAFCRQLCSQPRLPAGPLFGVNDWNYAYGRNTAAGILRDADLIASLAPSVGTRPLVVIDDGWQDPARFPSMPDLASAIAQRRLTPGLWIRPLRAPITADRSWLLPDARFGRSAQHSDLAYDPTHTEALHAAMESVRSAVDWKYEFIKHDFSTHELFGRWGSAMHADITAPDWHFYEKTRTNAEILRDFYNAVRQAAGERTMILGCNTVGHIAAGIFHSQRIADDTSGHDWERTRRYGVNGLAHRIAQHRTFFHVDPDCVAVTAQVGWRETRDWMDVVARSGTSLFFSPDPGAVTPEVKSAMRDALAIAQQSGSGAPVRPTSSTTPQKWRFTKPNIVERTYDWAGPHGVSPYDV